MNVYDLAARIFLKNLDVKYITDDKRKHVAGLAADAIDAANIFIDAVKQHEEKSQEAVTLPESQL